MNAMPDEAFWLHNNHEENPLISKAVKSNQQFQAPRPTLLYQFIKMIVENTKHDFSITSVQFLDPSWNGVTNSSHENPVTLHPT